MSGVSLIRLLPVLFFFILGSKPSLFAQKKNPEMEKRIDRIIQSMTLDDKSGELNVIDPGIVNRYSFFQ